MQNVTNKSIRSLDKAISVLDEISGIDGDIDLASLSRMVQMPKSTLLRILSTMKKHNFVHQDEHTKRFKLGLTLIALGKAAEKTFSLMEEVRPFLAQISERTGETASLMVLEGDHAVYIDQVVSKNIIRSEPCIGLSTGLHCSSGGKVLLSSMDDEQINALMKRTTLQRKTAKTLTNSADLWKEIKKVREKGYAIDDEEGEVGARCIAAPLRDERGEVIAALSVMGPSTRIRQKDFTELAQIVIEGASRVSRVLGYKTK